MAKSFERLEAIKLRKQGKSIGVISTNLGVSRGSVSLWCRDIKLTVRQLSLLEKSMNKGSYEGRLKGARIQKEKRLQEIVELNKEGANLVSSLSKRDIFFLGLGLYWGEGTKNNRFCLVNSDPDIIKLFIEWVRISWDISKEQLTLYVLINKEHKNRISEVEKFWSDNTGIPKNQFTKTVLIKSKNKKIYNNFKNHYGTLNVTVQKGGNLLHKTLGAISKFRNRMPG